MSDLNNGTEDWKLLRQDHIDDVKIDVFYETNAMKYRIKAKKGDRELEQEFNAKADPITYMPTQDTDDDFDRSVAIAQSLKQQLDASPN